MPAVDKLLKCWGFVNLSRYGLVLTPEGRILSIRPVVLDDGVGGRVVGWQDNDLAAMELQPWEPARPAPPPAIASRVASPIGPVIPPPASVPVMVIPERSVTTPSPMAAARVAPVVAAEPQVDEDEWEWEIALARARVAAEDAVVVEAAPRRQRADTVPPRPPAPARFVSAKTLPLGVHVAQVPHVGSNSPTAPRDSGAWPTTAPIGNIDYRGAVPSKPILRAIAPPVRPTVIPVPTLPTIRSTETAGVVVRVAPVVRSIRALLAGGSSGAPSTSMPPPLPPRRAAKGTSPVAGDRTDVGIAPARPADDERTIPGTPVMVADEQTRPGVALPVTRLPSIRARPSR